MFADRSLRGHLRPHLPPLPVCKQTSLPEREGKRLQTSNGEDGVYSDLSSDLYSDLSRKEITIEKPHKHWDEGVLSDLCEVSREKL